MNLERVKQVLKKVNALIENLEDQGQTSSIERDLLLRYLRDIYEDVSHPRAIRDTIEHKPDLTPSPIAEPVKTAAKLDTSFSEPEVERSTQPVQAPVMPDAVITEAKASSAKDSLTVAKENQTTFYDAASDPETAAIQPSEKTPQVVQPEEAVINTFENPVQYFPPEEEGTATVKEPAPQVTDSEKSSGRFDSVFVEKSATDIADKFQLQRVVTIEGAMGINERMLTINELFGGEHNVFMETVNHINNLTDFDSARTYLVDGAAARFNWDADERKGMASEFVQIVRRKFA